MKSEPPDPLLPRVWCDFNACGWSGAPGDNCYYAFDKQAVEALHPTEGMKLFVYDDEGDGEVVGCEARLEGFKGSWRIRPDESTWFRGRLSPEKPIDSTGTTKAKPAGQTATPAELSKLTTAFRQFLSTNPKASHNSYDGVTVDSLSADRHTITVTVTFKSGNHYCCAEPGCHFWLFGPDTWNRLRGLIAAAGVSVGSPLKVTIHGVVEEGALLEVLAQFGLPVSSPAYEYEHEFSEGPI